MRHVTPYELWVGNAGEVRDWPRLSRAGLRAVVDLAIDEAPAVVGREIVHCRFPLMDGAGNPAWLLDAAVGTVAGLVRGRAATLVYCSGGMSRSPCIAAAAVAVVSGRPAGECLAQVLRGGPGDVSGGLWMAVLGSVERVRGEGRGGAPAPPGR